MKKMSKLTLSVLGAFLCTTALAGCGDKVITNYETTQQFKLVSNHVTDYQLVVNDASKYNNLSFAISELNTFLGEATGATLTIIDETTGTVDDDLPFVSLGYTSLVEEYNVSLPSGYDYGDSGYYLKTVGGNIFILADENGNQAGLLYGVYDLLEQTIDYKAYASDEIEYTECADVYIPDLDKVYIPSFDARELGYRELISDKKYTSRMRMINRDTDGRWALHGHTAISDYCELLPLSKYYDEHPEWYATSGSQLCFTGHGTGYESMVYQMAYNMYHNYILPNKTAIYFMIGQSDNRSFCSCDTCVAKDKEYDLNGAVSGLIILFINDVIDKIDEMMTEAGDEENLYRDIRYVMFGYENTIKSFTSDKVVPNKKLYLEFTPIEMNFSKDMHTGTVNSAFYTYLTRWNELFEGRLLVYSYDVNYMFYLVNFNNFSTFKSYLEDYMENNVSYFYAQGPVSCNVTGLTYMRIYVESQILWDINLNYDDLVHEFMTHYFKEAGDAMEMYYKITRDRYAYYTTCVTDEQNGIYGAISNTALWDKSTVDSLASCIDDALKAIESFKETDPEYYEKIYYRIKREYITVLFLILSNFSGFYTSDTLTAYTMEFRSLCNYFNITKSYESGSGLPF